MKSNVRAQAVRPDAALPGLQHAADPRAMRELLQAYFGPDVAIQSVALHDFAYRPQRSARFVYELDLRERSGTRHRHVMHAWLGDAAQTRRRVAGYAPRTWTPPRFGPAFVHVPELGLLVWGFPNDPKLRLEALASSEQALETLRGVSALAPAERCTSSFVHYVPRKRIVMRHVLDPGERQVYTKSYPASRGAAIWDIACRLFEHSRFDPDAFHIAPPLAYLDESSTLVQEGLVGWTPLDESVWLNEPARVARLGGALARLHRSDLPLESEWGPAQEWILFEKIARALRRFEPHCGTTLDHLRERARRSAPPAGDGERVPLHGAFRLKQMLHSGERVALVDLDGVRRGDPVVDLGSFVAQMQTRVAKGRLRPAAAEAALSGLLDSYGASVPWPIAQPRLAWYTALRLVSKHAIGHVNHLKQDAGDAIRASLETALRILAAQRVTFG